VDVSAVKSEEVATWDAILIWGGILLLTLGGVLLGGARWSFPVLFGWSVLCLFLGVVGILVGIILREVRRM
jgi:uncharacterized membrane protein